MKQLRVHPEPQYQRRASDRAQAASSIEVRPDSSSGEQPIFRLDLLRSLQLHRGLALAILLAGLAGAAAYLLALWPLYTAQSLVYIQPAPPRVMDLGYTTRWPFDTNTYESYIAQQMVHVTRYDVLTNALRKLEPGAWQHKNESDQEAAERLARAVEVKRLGTSYEMSIAARASSAAMAAKLSNAVTASYLESAAREGKSGNTERMGMLREEEERVKAALTSDRTEQHELNKKLGLAGVGTNAPDLYDEDLSRVRNELVKARSASDEAAARLATLDGKNPHSLASLDAEADQVLSADAGLASMKVTLFQRRATLTSQMANLTPNHPQYKQDAEELSQIDNTLDSMTRDLRSKASVRIQQRLHTDLERTAGEESRLNAQLGQMSAAASGVTPKMQRENDLAADIVRLQNRYTAVDDQLHNLMLEDAAPASSYMAAAAVAPLQPVKSGVMRNTLAIALAGLLLGIMAAVTANKLDQKVYIASDVERVLGFAPMAVLPDFAQVSIGVAEEHVLRLSSGIEHARQQGNLKSCIFTGTGQGTGVTTVVTRVRTMLETMGRATVLVDASGTPPPPARAKGGLGLNDVASDLATHSGSRSTTLLQQLADEAEAGEGSLVLTDTAPLAVSAETEYLARFVDAAIVVIESGVTTRAELRDAAGALQRLEVGAVGFVLNRVGLQKADASFRSSVRGIEQHLRAQGRTYARSTERSRLSAAAPRSTKTNRNSEEAKAEPKVAEPPARSETASSQFRRRSTDRPAPELSAPSQAPSQFRRRSTDRAGVGIPLAGPPPQPDSSVPLMPQEVPVEVRPANPPLPLAPPQPLIRGREPAVAPPPRTTEPQIAVAPPPAPNVPWYRAQAAPQPVPAAQPSLAQPAPAQPAPAQTWERIATRFDDIQPEPVPEELPQPEPADTPFDSATRMTGLRNLIFSLGMKNPNMPAEEPEHVAEVPPPFHQAPERPAYDPTYTQQNYTPAPQPSSQRESAAPSRLVTAPPEFLPPKPVVETSDEDQEWNNPTKGHRDRRDAYDDVEILPSWRGQYRKKN